MKFSCDVCDKSIKLEAKRRHLQLLTDEELDISLERKHSIKSSVCLNIDKKINEHIINHHQKFELDLPK